MHTIHVQTDFNAQVIGDYSISMCGSVTYVADVPFLFNYRPLSRSMLVSGIETFIEPLSL